MVDNSRGTATNIVLPTGAQASNSGWSAGIGFSFGGQQNGFSLDLATNKSRGDSNGDDVTQTNTSIKAGQTVRLESGSDTNLKGAVVTGGQVQAKVGGSASSVLAGLFNETDPNETSEEREAKRNIIASVVTGIAAMSNPNGAATATNAAIANVDNNWLATQQLVQFGKEFLEAQSAADKIKVYGKWLSISGNQDLITGSALFKSFRDEMAGSGIDLLNGSVGFLRDPMASVDAMKEFAASADGRKILGAAYDAFQSQLNQISEALQKGGDANAENLGKQLGQALSLYAQMIATAGTGAAKGAATLSKAGIEVSSSGMKEIAASTKAAGGLEGKLAKLERVGPDPDVPQMPVVTPKPVDPPNFVLVDGAKYVESASIQANTTVQLSESVTLANGKVLPKGSIVTVSDDAMKVVYPDGTSDLSSYSKVTSKPLELPGGKEPSLAKIDAVAAQARQNLLDEINKIPSKSKASEQATMIGAYDPVTGKVAVGGSNANISADMLHVDTVKYIESKLGVKIGEFTSFCKNKVGACAEISAADSLVRQGVDPSKIRFTEALRPREVWRKEGVPDKAIVDTCANCGVSWPKGS